ncbi:hypothetical protein MSAN_00171600 [Mycena sanguinolenta]|uniref:Uncharacterized protein n=1 Tax=Mycena sanguinolenta TaxID=230812 RepID=A0A8H6ZJG6_9AGAR|nr:hypothetical protein MSAN_00171600 [Mycena sanguinolenta]
MERILKEEVLKEHKIHIHCFTDSPAFPKDFWTGSRICISGLLVRPFPPSLSSSSAGAALSAITTSRSVDIRMRWSG